jgi:hypothetical protein
MRGEADSYRMAHHHRAGWFNAPAHLEVPGHAFSTTPSPPPPPVNTCVRVSSLL